MPPETCCTWASPTRLRCVSLSTPGRRSGGARSSRKPSMLFGSPLAKTHTWPRSGRYAMRSRVTKSLAGTLVATIVRHEGNGLRLPQIGTVWHLARIGRQWSHGFVSNRDPSRVWRREALRTSVSARLPRGPRLPGVRRRRRRVRELQGDVRRLSPSEPLSAAKPLSEPLRQSMRSQI
jgi:hypothetical protein